MVYDLYGVLLSLAYAAVLERRFAIIRDEMSFGHRMHMSALLKVCRSIWKVYHVNGTRIWGFIQVLLHSMIARPRTSTYPT